MYGYVFRYQGLSAYELISSWAGKLVNKKFLYRSITGTHVFKLVLV